jgi:histidinol dehydrogenase
MAAKRQFESALKEFLAVTSVSGEQLRELEARYDKLNEEYERSESRAKTVHDRIRSVQQVGDALFREWKEELNEYTNQSLRRSSEEQLESTRRQYARLIDVMKAAEARMTPVLAAFKDQVLFLKHNLNARAIASLQQNVEQIQNDVTRLVREMEASIAEANAFIEQMQAAK